MIELSRILKKKERRIIGVMSGTSLDGVDIALVRCNGVGRETSLQLEAFQSYPMPTLWRQRIQEAFDASTEEVCRINFDLGYFFSEQLKRFLQEFNLTSDSVDAIGFHGQTIYHIHGHSTLQTGEADVIAQELNTVVISDFRTADIAAGGSGAPLVPYLDQLLFQEPGKNIVLQNLGGIGNLTFLPGTSEKEILAFDTGPANAILNELTEIISAGAYHFDEDARFSAKGKVQSALLEKLCEHPYFKAPLPKSTGREQFGKNYVAGCLQSFPDIDQLDLLRTFVALIGASIHNACRTFLPPVDKIYISGGGVHHPLIMWELKRWFGEGKVAGIDNKGGISADSKEAVAFALLAHERLNGVPTNVPSVTGARSLTTLGKLSVPSVVR